MDLGARKIKHIHRRQLFQSHVNRRRHPGWVGGTLHPLSGILRIMCPLTPVLEELEKWGAQYKSSQH